jgi:DNA-binding response OmpR family regulator
VRILIIEDEFLVADYLESIVREMGHDEVFVALDIATGMSLLEAMSPDFAILDVNIGQALVFPLATKLLQRKIPFVFSTAKPKEWFPEEWRNHPVIPKPLETERLVATMAALGVSHTKTSN